MHSMPVLGHYGSIQAGHLNPNLLLNATCSRHLYFLLLFDSCTLCCTQVWFTICLTSEPTAIPVLISCQHISPLPRMAYVAIHNPSVPCASFGQLHRPSDGSALSIPKLIEVNAVFTQTRTKLPFLYLSHTPRNGYLKAQVTGRWPSQGGQCVRD